MKRALSILKLMLIASLISSAALIVNAQATGSNRGPASSGGRNMIQGRVHFPAGETATGKTIKVSLESVSAFGSMSTVADQDGVFRFTSLEAGDYTVVVDAGNEYEKAREPVSIYRDAAPSGRSFQVAIQLYPKVASSNPLFANVPEKALALYQKGSAAGKGDAKGAVESLSAAVAAYSNFPTALSELGAQYLILKQYDKAGQTFEQLVKLKPNDPTAHLNLGIVAYNQKKLEEAEGHL